MDEGDHDYLKVMETENSHFAEIKSNGLKLGPK